MDARVVRKFRGLAGFVPVSFSPTFLGGHGHLFISMWPPLWVVLWRPTISSKHCKKRLGKNILIAGIALGIAELLKFSAILLFPAFILLTGIWLCRAETAGGGGPRRAEAVGEGGWRTRFRKAFQIIFRFPCALPGHLAGL